MADIKPWLVALNFSKCEDIYELTINDHKIIIDLINEKIHYPQLKEIGRNTTTNFSSEENFVVLEAIVNLLKQGYCPNQISIEKSYRLGHNTKSGNADITVEDNNGNPFLIIEAKTYGTEFDKEWKNTLADGGQLFSYEKQDNKAKVLILYASCVEVNKIKRIYHAIKLLDNDEFLSTLDKPRGYKNAKGGNDKFEIWRDTYQYDYISKGILEETVKPFEIGKAKASTLDLKTIEHDEVQKKYNQFATILRKYNVGGRENAFDKLVNLFLTKIVDEQQNQSDLQFGWKGVAYDTYFELVDRLQKLYQIGMEKFLNEKVSYVAEKDVEAAFRLRKDAAKDAVLKYFKELKYYSNNDFTFLDVYNEQLFYQNSKILVEVVQMLQDMKLRAENQNQFLGDLFEGFLDNGVKQSEGQFFTPLPIAKFIISSLPIERINNSSDIPKIIDYACGAGHFLNEYAEQIKPYVEKDKLKEYYSSIYGIEKEYRLSKVAKVSAFMYGQDDINIIYGDGLIKHKKIENNSFSVLVANPPYSVKGFLETLSETERNKYELMNYVDKLDTNNSIELFFLERAEQLLKSEGVAAIIVPSTVLSNGNLYTKARKMLIENFEFVAISELCSNAFGKTPTKTVILFLQKKKYPPKEADGYRYAVERWFDNDDVQTADEDIIISYCNNIEIDYQIYCELRNGTLNELLKLEMFEEYVQNFEKSQSAKKIFNKKITAKYTQDMKNREYIKAQFNYIQEIEKDKVFYFALADSQKRKVVIVKSPTDNTEIKRFLGYEWSKRRGNEGIKYIGVNISDDEMEVSKNQAISSIKTPLFNPLDLYDEGKINSLIRKNYNNTLESIPKELDKFVATLSLVDMLDFTNISFEAQIKTSIEKGVEIKSKYPIEKLSNKKLGVRIIKGVTYAKKDQVLSKTKNKILTSDNITLEGKLEINKVIYVDSSLDLDIEKQLRENDILMTFSSGSKKHVGKVAFIEKDEGYYAGGFMGIIRIEENVILPKYLFEILNSKYYRDIIINKSSGQGINNLSNSISQLKIPVPEKDVQNNLLMEIEELDKQYNSSRMKIEEYQKRIAEIFETLEIVGGGG